MSDQPAPRDPWAALSRFTPARIALGRTGGSVPTREQFGFQLSHARARDAVRHVADLEAIAAALAARGLPSMTLESAAPDHLTYLQRPDLGRRLSAESRAVLGSHPEWGPADLALVIADGLSGLAVERHAVPLAALVRAGLVPEGWTVAPVALVRRGRVAVGDEVGERLRALLVLVLIGERPGLSSPDSLGAYLTWDPHPGRKDAERNCLSNIRPEGLPVPLASERLLWLVREARRRRLTGVALKDETSETLPAADG
jgi:ethanolamine ammonia-lyase small subunit